MSATAADYLAAERTFLAWIRTGLALMGLGFVVARFGLFLQTLQLSEPARPAQPYGLSFWFGTALILLGVVVQALCAIAHIRLVQRLARGDAAFGRPSTLAVTLAALLALLGLGLAIYLISVRDPVPQRSSIAIPDRKLAIEQIREKNLDARLEHPYVSTRRGGHIDANANDVPEHRVFRNCAGGSGALGTADTIPGERTGG